MRERSSIWTRWLGVGLASALSVLTLGLTATGQLGLYVNPDSAWFAVGMSLFVLVGTVASFALPLGAEADHGHDHDHGHGHGHPSTELPLAEPVETSTSSRGATHRQAQRAGTVRRAPGAGRIASLVGGVTASAIVLLALALPPASLSAELAMSRDTGAVPLFGGADTVALAKTGDTASFGVGDWSTVFATTTNPESFDGEPVTLTGFVTPGSDGFDLTRLVITHCVIDAQPASVPVASNDPPPETGQWVTVTGAVRARSDGRLVIAANTVEEIPEPEDPYEY